MFGIGSMFGGGRSPFGAPQGQAPQAQQGALSGLVRGLMARQQMGAPAGAGTVGPIGQGVPIANRPPMAAGFPNTGFSGIGQMQGAMQYPQLTPKPLPGTPDAGGGLQTAMGAMGGQGAQNAFGQAAGGQMNPQIYALLQRMMQGQPGAPTPPVNPRPQTQSQGQNNTLGFSAGTTY